MQDKRILCAVAIALSLLILAGVYFFVDPMQAKWLPRCIWKVATGTDCPGCGSQRMAHALMHGDFRTAWKANSYALCMLPLIGTMLWLELFREKHHRLYRKVHSPVVIWSLVASVLIWWIARNLV